MAVRIKDRTTGETYTSRASRLPDTAPLAQKHTVIMQRKPEEPLMQLAAEVTGGDNHEQDVPPSPQYSGKFDEPSTPGWRYGEIADEAQRYAAAMTPTSDMYLNPYTADAASFMQSEADKALADAAYYREKENSENKALEDQRKITNQAFRAVDMFTPLEIGAWINSPEQYDAAQKMYDQAAAEDAKLKAMGGRAARELPLTVPKNFFAGAVGAVRGLVNEAGYIAQGATKAQMDENAEMWRRMGREDYARDMEKARDALGDMQNWAQFGQPYISSVAEETAGYGKGGQILGNVAQGVGGMVPSILSNLAVPGIGLPVMFFQASGNATEEAKAAGASDEAAALYGTAVGAVEVLTEKMFGGIPGLNIGALDEGIENIIKQKVGNEAAQRAIMFLVDALGEGVEEFTSEFGDYFLDKWLVKHDDRSLNEVGKDALYSFLIGALTSVAMQAPVEVANMAKTRRGREQLAQIVADQVEQQIEQPDAAKNATQSAVNEPLMQLAQEMATEQITAARDAELRAQEASQAQAAIPAQQTAPTSEIQPQQAPSAAQEASERQTAPAVQAEETPAQAQKKPAARAENPGLDMKDSNTAKANLSYRTRRTLDTMGKVLGVEIRFADTLYDTDGAGNVIRGADGKAKRVQGKYKDGVITLALDAKDPFLTTAVHETVHRIRELSGDDYTTLKNFVLRNMSDEQLLKDQRVKGQLYDAGTDITEETVADAFGRMMGDEAKLRQFVKENSDAAQRILDALNDLLTRVKAALGGDVGTDTRTLTDEQRAVYSDLAGKLEKMVSLYNEAMQSASESEGTASEGARFSIQQFENGQKYVDVDVDQSLFDGLTTEQMQTVAKREIMKRFKGKVIGKDYTAYVNKRSAEHYAYPANRRMDITQKQDKMRASTELDHILEVSNFRRNEADDGRHPGATGGLDKLSTMFRVNGRLYEAEITALVTDRGRVFYDMTKFKDITGREIGQTHSAAETPSDVFNK